MPCVHLRQLIQLCEDNQIKVGGADMIHFVCEQCGIQEVCPDMMLDEYDARTGSDPQEAPRQDAAQR